MTSKSRRKGAFLAAYKLEDRDLQRADRKSGRPALTLGVDEIGNHVLIKSWPRTTGDGQDELRDLWQHEIRHLYRLGGYPDASTSIATLLQAGFDDAGFYLVLDLGQREPLTTLLQHRQAAHWLKNPRITRNRLLLWQNLSQIAVALEILHDQGLLHRNVDQWLDPRFRRKRARLSADRVRVVAKACGRGQRSKRDAHKNRCASLLR